MFLKALTPDLKKQQQKSFCKVSRKPFEMSKTRKNKMLVWKFYIEIIWFQEL